MALSTRTYYTAKKKKKIVQDRISIWIVTLIKIAFQINRPHNCLCYTFKDVIKGTDYFPQIF